MSAPVPLRPCPFCGGEAEYADVLVAFEGETPTVMHKCSARSRLELVARSKSEAIAAWNRRAVPATAAPGGVQGNRGAVPRELPDEWHARELAAAVARADRAEARLARVLAMPENERCVAAMREDSKERTGWVMSDVMLVAFLRAALAAVDVP